MLIHAHIALAPQKPDGTFILEPHVIDLSKSKSVIIILPFIKKKISGGFPDLQSFSFFIDFMISKHL